MTKHDLVMRVSEQTGEAQQKVMDYVERIMDGISAALIAGEKVELRNFGVFEIKVRKPRVGRNPHKPEANVPIPSRAVVKFRAGKELREAVLRLSPNKTAA